MPEYLPGSSIVPSAATGLRCGDRPESAICRLRLSFRGWQVDNAKRTFLTLNRHHWA